MRNLLYIAGGSAAYAALNLLAEHLSFPGLEVVRPGIAVPILCGLLFGPVVGLGVGFLGSVGSDLLTFGFYWNWSLGNGLVGMVAGLGPFLFSRIRRQWLTIFAAAAVGAIAIVLGAGLTAITDIFVANLTPDTAISAELIPLSRWNLLWGLLLSVATMGAWVLVRRRPTRRAAKAPGVG